MSREELSANSWICRLKKQIFQNAFFQKFCTMKQQLDLKKIKNKHLFEFKNVHFLLSYPYNIVSNVHKCTFIHIYFILENFLQAPIISPLISLISIYTVSVWPVGQTWVQCVILVMWIPNVSTNLFVPSIIVLDTW